jgi:hypothetical protein
MNMDDIAARMRELADMMRERALLADLADRPGTTVWVCGAFPELATRADEVGEDPVELVLRAQQIAEATVSDPDALELIVVLDAAAEQRVRTDATAAAILDRLTEPGSATVRVDLPRPVLVVEDEAQALFSGSGSGSGRSLVIGHYLDGSPVRFDMTLPGDWWARFRAASDHNSGSGKTALVDLLRAASDSEPGQPS